MCFLDHTQLEDCISPIEKNNYVSIDIKKSYKSNEILEKTAKNCTDMTVHDAIDTIFTLFKASKNMEENLQNIKQHIGFIRLCEVLNRNIRLMKTNEIINSLRMLTYFKIPANCVLIQSLLQMIRANVNEISLQDIINVIVLLKKMDSTPLRDALLIALPVVFEAQLPTKLELDNISMLTQSLRLISENNINNPEIQNMILKSLQKSLQTNLNVQTAWSIFCSLCVASYLSPIAFELLFNIQKILISDAKQLSISDIKRALNKLVLVTARKYVVFIRFLILIFDIVKNKISTICYYCSKDYGCKFYNEALVDAFVNSALSAEISFDSSIYLLKLLNELNYAHIPFLEYLAAKCFEQPTLLKNASYFRISIFLEGLINADYKPVFWDVIRDAILANKVENKVFNRSMIKFALHLIALDCYSPNLISKVFSKIINTNEPMKNIHMRELLLLYQSVKTLYPAYNGPWPSQDILEHAISIHKTLLGPILPTFSLKMALELALGGPQYVYNDMRTKLGHYIGKLETM